MKKLIILSLGAIVIAFGIIQLIPFELNHTNPPVAQEPNWDTPQTRALAQRACFDCHSNETVWPWYSNIAPVSWLVQNDVIEGRQKLNFSNWSGQRIELDEISEVILGGYMPPASFASMHPQAKLTPRRSRIW